MANLISANYRWALHKTWISQFPSIAADGLEPFRDFTPSDKRINEALGENGLSIVFFTPLGASQPTNPVGKRGEDQRQAGDKNFHLAVCCDDLPNECGVDWVLRHNWIVQLLNNGSASDEEIFRLIDEFGSFVVYERVPAEKLRVRSLGSDPLDPASWPALKDAQADAVIVF